MRLAGGEGREAGLEELGASDRRYDDRDRQRGSHESRPGGAVWPVEPPPDARPDDVGPVDRLRRSSDGGQSRKFKTSWSGRRWYGEGIPTPKT